MATTITRQNLRRELYNRIPQLGFAGTADSIAAGSITDAFALADTTVGANHWRGFYIYRPDRTTDDRVKKANVLTPSSGLLTHSGSNYADTTDLNYELVGLMHPDELNACLTRAHGRVDLEVLHPLTVITDGDMETSGVGSWTSNSLATHEKVTTAARIFSGSQALHIVTDAVDEYTESGNIKVFGNEPFYASTVVHADVADAELIVYDKTNSAEIGTAVTSDEEGFVHLWTSGRIPATCEEVSIRLGSPTSGADLYFSHAIFYPLDRMLFDAPSWLDEQWKFVKLREAVYKQALSSQTNGGYDAAFSRTFKDWYQPSQVTLDPLHHDANKYRIQLMRATPFNELWIHGKRPYSDLETTFSTTDSATYQGPAELFYAYAKEEIAKVLRMRYPTDERWVQLHNEAILEVAAQTMSHPELPVQPSRKEFWSKA